MANNKNNKNNNKPTVVPTDQLLALVPTDPDIKKAFLDRERSFLDRERSFLRDAEESRRINAINANAENRLKEKRLAHELELKKLELKAKELEVKALTDKQQVAHSFKDKELQLKAFEAMARVQKLNPSDAGGSAMKEIGTMAYTDCKDSLKKTTGSFIALVGWLLGVLIGIWIFWAFTGFMGSFTWFCAMMAVLVCSPGILDAVSGNDNNNKRGK